MPIVLLVTVVSVLGFAASPQRQAPPSQPAERDTVRGELVAAIEAGCSHAECAFLLDVACSDRQGFRSFELFENGALIWQGRAQSTLSRETRRSLLETLQRLEFPTLEPTYGGRLEADREKREVQAALRIICRVELEIEGVRKRSIQLAEGEQSPQLAKLAIALLDLVEPIGEAGATAEDLADGLRKLAVGELSPEGFELRLVRLPPAGKQEPGTILRVDRSTVSLRAYAPGRELGAPLSAPLSDSELDAVLDAMRLARLWELPVNLFSQSHIELGVRVLNHRRTVIARPFTRLEVESRAEAQSRFDQLIAELRGLEQRTVVAQPEPPPGKRIGPPGC